MTTVSRNIAASIARQMRHEVFANLSSEECDALMSAQIALEEAQSDLRMLTSNAIDKVLGRRTAE